MSMNIGSTHFPSFPWPSLSVRISTAYRSLVPPEISNTNLLFVVVQRIPAKRYKSERSSVSTSGMSWLVTVSRNNLGASPVHRNCPNFGVSIANFNREMYAFNLPMSSSNFCLYFSSGNSERPKYLD